MTHTPSYQARIATQFSELWTTLKLTVIDTYYPFNSRYKILVECTCDDGDNWSEVAIISAFDARRLALHLQNAAGAIDPAESTSPATARVGDIPARLTLCGSRFDLDEFSRQLRSVDNPEYVFDLDVPKK